MIMHKLKLPTDQASEASIVMVRKMPQGYKRSNRPQSIEPWQERQEQRKDEAVDTFVRPFLKDNLPPQTSVAAAMDDNRSDTATDGEREGKCLPFHMQHGVRHLLRTLGSEEKLIQLQERAVLLYNEAFNNETVATTVKLRNIETESRNDGCVGNSIHSEKRECSSMQRDRNESDSPMSMNIEESTGKTNHFNMLKTIRDNRGVLVEDRTNAGVVLYPHLMTTNMTQNCADRATPLLHPQQSAASRLRFQIDEITRWYFRDYRSSPLDFEYDISGSEASDDEHPEYIKPQDLAHLSDSNCTRCAGFLLKQSKNDRSLWRKRFCILAGDKLWYMKIREFD